MSQVPRGFPKRGLVVVEGDRLLHNFAFATIADALWALPDIDQNGHDELVFFGSFGMGGQWSSGATLVEGGKEGLRDLWSEEVYASACDAGYEGATSVRITVVPGSLIMIQRFSMESCETQVWVPLGEAEPLVPGPTKGSPYVDLLEHLWPRSGDRIVSPMTLHSLA